MNFINMEKKDHKASQGSQGEQQHETEGMIIFSSVAGTCHVTHLRLCVGGNVGFFHGRVWHSHWAKR